MQLVTASLTAVFRSPSSSRVGSSCAAKQAALLRAEGVPFRPDGTADLARCLWQGPM